MTMVKMSRAIMYEESCVSVAQRSCEVTLKIRKPTLETGTKIASSTLAILRTLRRGRIGGLLLIGRRFVHIHAAAFTNTILTTHQELIKVRAFQVAPPELEGVLLDHPDIVDAAVIGIPDPASQGGSEAPRAYAVRRQGSEKLSSQDIDKFMRERLASYKQLTGGIVFVDQIPKTPSGKILKRVLREQAKSEMAAKL